MDLCGFLFIYSIYDKSGIGKGKKLNPHFNYIKRGHRLWLSGLHTEGMQFSLQHLHMKKNKVVGGEKDLFLRNWRITDRVDDARLDRLSQYMTVLCIHTDKTHHRQVLV